MNRRDFLATTTAAAMLPRIGLAAQNATQNPAHLRAEAVISQILPEGDGATRMLGFNGAMPGPELRIPRGQRSEIAVENGLDEGTAVHWHGIRLDNSMDGVPMLTQKPIAPGETFRYAFIPPDAGTYWYHSHHTSYAQVARGLMGPLIVEDDTPPDVDHDITALISDWRITREGVLMDDFNDRHSIAHAGSLGTFARVFLSQDTVRRGDRVRLRLINAATNRIFPLSFGDAMVQLVALDGMPLATPRDASDLILAPAQRADVIVDVTADLTLDMATRQGPYNLGLLAVHGENTDRTPTPIRPLAPNAVAEPQDPAQHLTLTMQGGAMGGAHGGDNIWAFNDLSGMQDQPFGRFQRGETAKITLINDTRFPHGMHLHGHHFYELTAEGGLGDYRDTTLLAGERRDILCVFDNPGRWMLHCHMLSHAAGGMRSWVEVV